MKISELKELIESGEFHHASYRSFGTLWEGLWIYKRDSKAARGFFPVGSFLKDDPQVNEAHSIVRHSGVSVGAYGQG